MRIVLATCTLLIASLCAPTLWSATLHVPTDHLMIQSAIAAAVPGDTIIVGPGAYAENLNFLGKDITVVSSDGPGSTTLDGSWAGPVVQFVGGEGPSAVLEGFTIAHGRIAGGFTGGAGIRCLSSSPTIRGNIIRDNIGEFVGAGIYLEHSTALITENLIHDNHFICMVVDSGCGIGGGIFAFQGAPTIAFNQIYDNVAENAGGGVFLHEPVDADVIGNHVHGNSGGSGGGIQVFGGGVSIVNNLIHDNLAIGFITIAGPTPGPGGGLHFSASTQGDVLGCTIVANQCTAPFGATSGGGVFSASAAVAVRNSIIWNNTATTSAQLDTAGTVTYSLVQFGHAGQGNLSADPLFVTGVPGNFLLSQIAAGQGADSPAVDAGDPTLVTPLGTTRTDAVPDGGAPDIGFHYVSGPTLGPVFERGDCNADGSSNIADAVFLLGNLFPLPGSPPNALGCDDACDTNDDGALNISDAVRLLNALFGPATPLPSPYGSCGTDSTVDVLDCLDHDSCMPI